MMLIVLTTENQNQQFAAGNYVLRAERAELDELPTPPLQRPLEAVLLARLTGFLREAVLGPAFMPGWMERRAT